MALLRPVPRARPQSGHDVRSGHDVTNASGRRGAIAEFGSRRRMRRPSPLED